MFFLYIYFLSINWTEWSTIPACPSLMCYVNRGNAEGTNSLKMCVWCLCLMFVSDVCVQCLCPMFVSLCFMFVKWLVYYIDLTEGWYICEKSLEVYICLWPEFDCPEVTLCCSQDVKIQLLLLLLYWMPCELGVSVILIGCWVFLSFWLDIRCFCQFDWILDVSVFVCSTSQFISVGLDMLVTLAASSQYSAVIHILSCVTPQFLSTPQYLLENET